MAYAFNEDKSRVEVLPASNTYTKNEVYTKNETSSVLASYVTKAIADATYVPQTTSALVPSGAIMQFAGSVAPAGWVLCDGRSLSKNTFTDLFNAIGYTYGGSGNTFNVPDLRDKFPIGKNAGALGSTGGSSTKTLTIANLPAHTHGRVELTGSTEQRNTVAMLGGTANQSGIFGKGSVRSYAPDWIEGQGVTLRIDASHEHESVGEGQAFDNMPPYITLNYIIKT